ncbi:MAG TPA: hypothetical protein VL128_00610 [Candidatus Eisenbacteria bacterium]|nr:hypothetical protein [Candidatus Eisenbacteria bacterium]
MKTIALLGPTAILVALAGCSGNHPTATSAPAALPAASQPARAPSAEPPVQLTPVALPSFAAQPTFAESWRPEPVDDHLGGAIVLKRASLDGKYDLVILRKGAQAFVAFAGHGRWDAVHQQPAHGKLMYLRVKFEDGLEKRAEWDELAAGSADLHAVLWSYPADPVAELGPAANSAKNEVVGGDQFLMQDMMKHRAMILEIEPGVTTQFDLTGLEKEMGMIRPFNSEPILSASQTQQ